MLSRADPPAAYTAGRGACLVLTVRSPGFDVAGQGGSGTTEGVASVVCLDCRGSHSNQRHQFGPRHDRVHLVEKFDLARSL